MAGGHAADRDSRGGERIPPPRARTRLVLAAAAVATAAGVALYAAFEADRVALLVLALGAGAVVLMVFGLAVPRPSALLGSLVGIGASWSLSAWTRCSGAPGGTILAAAGIFVAAELAYWSLEQASVPDEPELLARRAGGLALRAAGAVVPVSFALAALGLHAGGGLMLEAVGAAAAVALLALVLLLARAGHELPER